METFILFHCRCADALILAAHDGTCSNGITVLPATHTFIHKWNEPSCLTPQPQSITALWPVLISRPAEGRRLSSPVWLGKDIRVLCPPKMVTHPSSNWAQGMATSFMNDVTAAPNLHLKIFQHPYNKKYT